MPFAGFSIVNKILTDGLFDLEKIALPKGLNITLAYIYFAALGLALIYPLLYFLRKKLVFFSGIVAAAIPNILLLIGLLLQNMG